MHYSFTAINRLSFNVYCNGLSFRSNQSSIIRINTEKPSQWKCGNCSDVPCEVLLVLYVRYPPVFSRIKSGRLETGKLSWSLSLSPYLLSSEVLLWVHTLL